MPIEIRCSACDKLLKAKDSMAGKRVKCPACSNPIDIPKSGGDDEIYDAEVVENEPDPFAGLPSEYDQPEGEAEPPKRACPMCGEMIPVTAKKCRFCGEMFGKKKKKSSRGFSDDEEMTGVDWFLVVCCPTIGCIVGIVRLCQGKSSGGKMIGLAFLFAFLWNVISFALQAITENMR